MGNLQKINDAISSVVFGMPTTMLFLAVGILFTIGCGFFQIKKIKLISKKTFLSLFDKSSRTKSVKNSFSKLQSLSTSLAATIGTGSIVGVAAAITTGGAGAVFWMWICAFFGMMTAFAENVLAIKYRKADKNGGFSGSAMHYMERGLNAKWLGKIFALFCVLASFGMGNMAQGNSVASAANEAFGVPVKISAIILTSILVVVVIGGIQALGRVTELCVPFMAIFYVAGTLIILVLNFDKLPSVMSCIVKDAFGFSSACGGAVGIGVKKAIEVGFRRGVFSNEAGLGTTASVHASSETKEPVEQGMWGMLEVFIDTFIICTLTAFVILVTNSAGNDEAGSIIVTSFSRGLGGFGKYFAAISIILFSVATIIGWSFIGEKAFEYLFPKAKASLYKAVFVTVTYIGAISSVKVVLDISDTFNGLMAIPNIVALILLSGEVISETKSYLKSRTRHDV